MTARGTVGKAFYRKENFSAIGRLLVLNPKYNLSGKLLAEIINERITFSKGSTGVPQLIRSKYQNISKCAFRFRRTKSHCPNPVRHGRGAPGPAPQAGEDGAGEGGDDAATTHREN